MFERSEVPLTDDEEMAMIVGDLRRIGDVHAGRPVPRFPGESHARSFFGDLQGVPEENRPRAVRAFRDYLAAAYYEVPAWLQPLLEEYGEGSAR